MNIFNLSSLTGEPTSDGIQKNIGSTHMTTLENLKLPEGVLESRKLLKKRINSIVDRILIYEINDAQVHKLNNLTPGELERIIRKVLLVDIGI